MSVAAHGIDPVDLNWRILQGTEEKKMTSRALSRDATQARRQRHGSKSYDREKDSGGPRVRPDHLSLVTSGLRMPETGTPDLAFEPISIVPDEILEEIVDLRMVDTDITFDGGVPLEIIGEDVPDEFAYGLPHGFRIDFEGANDLAAIDSRTHVHGFERRTLQHALDQIEPDLDDPEFVYSHCEPLHLPLNK